MQRSMRGRLNDSVSVEHAPAVHALRCRSAWFSRGFAVIAFSAIVLQLTTPAAHALQSEPLSLDSLNAWLASGRAKVVPAFSDPAVPSRLTVRPHEMATATRTGRAGDFQLDSLENYWVYVPPQCVGERRCPLAVFLHWGAMDASVTLQWQRPVADKYGMIVLAPTSVDGAWSVEGAERDRRNVDAALKQVLRKFAIDLDRIALIGHCASGPTAMIWGGQNMDIFSRVVPISAGYPPTAAASPPNGKTEFYLDAGFPESEGNFRAARELRRAGHRVKLVVGLRGHEQQAEDFDFLGRWLQESWVQADPAARMAPSVVADPLPVLTVDALAKLTRFWAAFEQEPDSIWTVARRAHLREVVVPVGQERPSIVMTEMPALAAQYPSVAAKLEAAGLTARQHDVYRVALLSAQLTESVGAEAGPVEATSVLAKNVAFLAAHPDELKTFWDSKIWRVP